MEELCGTVLQNDENEDWWCDSALRHQAAPHRRNHVVSVIHTILLYCFSDFKVHLFHTYPCAVLYTIVFPEHHTRLETR